MVRRLDHSLLVVVVAALDMEVEDARAAGHAS